MIFFWLIFMYMHIYIHAYASLAGYRASEQDHCFSDVTSEVEVKENGDQLSKTEARSGMCSW